MSMDEQLRAVLRTEAKLQTTPGLDVGSLIDGGNRRRQRRRLRRGLAAGIGCAVAVSVVLLAGSPTKRHETLPSDQPQRVETVDELPAGSAPSIPYCSAGKLHGVAGTHCLPMVHRGTTTVAYSEDGVQLLVPGRLTTLDRRTPSHWAPAMSQDGRYVAWVTDGVGKAGALLVFDGHTARKVAEVAVPTTNAWVPGIDDHGRVYVYSFAPEHPMWMYDLATGTLVGVTREVSGAVRYVTADGFGTERTGISPGRRLPRSVVGTVDDSGRWTAQGTVDIGWSSWSPDRSLAVEETGDGSWAVLDVATSQVRRTLALPTSGRPIALPVWESDDDVLFVFDPRAAGLMAQDASDGDSTPKDRTLVVRCSVSSGACEIALTSGYAGDQNDVMYR